MVKLLLSLLLLLHLAPLPAMAADKRPLILVLSDDKGARGEVSADSFVLALLVHLKPDHVDIQLSKWTAPPTLEDQEVLAGHRCSKSKAAAATWYTVAGEGEAARVTAHVVSFSHGAFQRQSMEMGQPQPGIERSLAISVRTLVSAHLARLSALAKPEPPEPPPGPPAPRVVKPRPRPQAHRVELGVSYDMDIFPLGDEVRHGPTAAAHLRIWRRLHAQLGLGYRTTGDGSSKLSWWSRDFLCIDLALANWWRVHRRLELLGGGHARGTVVFSSAGRVFETETEQAALWELSLGLTGGAKLRLWSRLSALLSFRVAWLPVGHLVSVAGMDVADPGGFEVSMALGLMFGAL